MDTNLLTFTVNLQDDGDLRTDLVYVDPKLLVDTLNDISPEYPNTHIIAAILRNYLREINYAITYVEKVVDTL